jgi:hypothetical protein
MPSCNVPARMRRYRRLVHFEHHDANSEPARMLSPASVSDKCPAHARAVAAIVLKAIAMTRLRRRVIPVVCRPSNSGCAELLSIGSHARTTGIYHVRVVGACNQPALSCRAVSMERGGSGLSIQRGLSGRDRRVFEHCSPSPQLGLTQYWCGGYSYARVGLALVAALATTDGQYDCQSRDQLQLRAAVREREAGRSSAFQDRPADPQFF